MKGRRVPAFEDIEQPGDYYGPVNEVNEAGDVVRTGVWFLLPIHEGDKYSRATIGSGLHRVTQPPWTFRECADGSLEIRASIACGSPVYWHGYLDEGHIWRQV